MAEQTVNLSMGSPVDFVKKILELGKQGFVLKDNTFPRLKGFPITASFTIETDKTIQMEPGIHTIPIPISQQVFKAEDLEAMDWDSFKDAVKSRGVKGRQRDVMQAKYLKAVEDGVQDVSEE